MEGTVHIYMYTHIYIYVFPFCRVHILEIQGFVPTAAICISTLFLTTCTMTESFKRACDAPSISISATKIKDLGHGTPFAGVALGLLKFNKREFSSQNSSQSLHREFLEEGKISRRPKNMLGKYHTLRSQITVS